MNLAYDGAVVIDTRMNTSGVTRGVREIGKRIEALTGEFEAANRAIEEQVSIVSDLEKRYDAAVEKAKELEETGSKTEWRNAAKEAFNLSRELEDAQKSLDGMNDRAASLKDSIASAQSEGVFKFSEQAEQAEADIRLFEETLNRLYEQLDREQDPATIVALRHEIAATETAFEKFKDNISQPITDIFQAREIEAEIQRINDEIQRLTSAAAMAEDPFQKMFYESKIWLEKIKLPDLREQLEQLKEADVSGVSDKVEDIGKSAQGSTNSASQLNSIIQSIGAAAMKVGSVAVGGIKELGSGLLTVAKRALSAAKNILMIGKHSRTASSGIGGLTNRLVRLAKNVFVFSMITSGLRKMREMISDLIGANAEMSASLNAIQVHLLTAFVPIWQVIQPALVTFLALIERGTAALATFIATLFGQTYEQAQATAQALYEQIKAFRELAKEAAKSGKKLAGFDKINQLAQDTASEGLDFGAVTAPDFDWMNDFIDKIKEIAGNIWDVFKAAWDNVGDYALEGWKYAFQEILGLIKDIAATLYEVWTDGHGQAFLESIITLLGTIGYIIGDIARAFREAWSREGYNVVASIFEALTNVFNLLNSIGVAFRAAWDEYGVSIATNILQIYTNIFQIISNLAIKLREAWEESNNGVRIWGAILGFINDVLSTINRMTAATLDWVKNLNLGPLMGGVANLAEAFRRLAGIVVDAFGWAYTNILLPFTKWLAELFVPAALNLLSAAFDAISAVLKVLQPWAMWVWENFLQPIAKWAGDGIVKLINMLTDAFKAFSDWAKENQGTIDLIISSILGFFAGLLLYSAVPAIIAWLKTLGEALAAFGVKGLIAAIGANAPAVALGLLAAAIAAVASVWSKLSTGERILAAIGVAALAAAAAIAIFHTSWTAGLAAAAIIAGIVGIIATFAAVKGQLGSSISGLSNMGSFTSALSSVQAGSPSMPSSARSMASRLSGNSPLPKLARGGMIDEATIALIGEKGREAVIPLDRDRGALQEIADRIASKINMSISGLASGGRPQTIILETDGRQWARVHLPYMEEENIRIGTRMDSSGGRIHR